jgi:hypothetical protein
MCVSRDIEGMRKPRDNCELHGSVLRRAIVNYPITIKEEQSHIYSGNVIRRLYANIGFSIHSVTVYGGVVGNVQNFSIFLKLNINNTRYHAIWSASDVRDEPVEWKSEIFTSRGW